MKVRPHNRNLLEEVDRIFGQIALANSEASLAEAKKQLDAKIVQFDAVQQLLKDLKTQFEIADAKSDSSSDLLTD